MAQFTTKYQECTSLIDSESDEAADTTGARGLRDENLTTLRSKGRLALTLLKVKFRTVPNKLRLVSSLVMRSDSAAGTLTEAGLVESAWEQADAAYVLEDGTTLAAFRTLITTCRANVEAVNKEAAEESDVAGLVLVKLEVLYDLCVAWYAVATALYSEATAHGIMIRNQIPTQPSGNGPLPGVVTLTIEGGIGLANLTFAAENAVTFLIRRRPQGVPGPTYQDTGLAVGFYEYVVVPQNLEGDGPESDVVTVEVT